jgi:predicted SprT family Zn-dependent metalloprotease
MIVCKCGGRVEVIKLERDGEAYIPVYQCKKCRTTLKATKTNIKEEKEEK